MKDCVFCKIAKHEIPKEFEYEDDDLMVFPDIDPSKGIHMLVVPKKHYEDFLDFNDDKLLYKTKKMINKVIKEQKLDNRGYRITTNGGGAQLVKHVHFHVKGPISREMEV